MYFSTVLVLLLTFEFSQLQPIQTPIVTVSTKVQSIPPSPDYDILPFGYVYTEKTEEFLKKTLKDFNNYPLKENLKVYVKKFLQNKQDLGYEELCKTRKINRPPFFELEEDNCTGWCHENNPRYVEFLNYNIVKIRNLLFQEEDDFIIVLIATHSENTNTVCVKNEKKQKFYCLCGAHYKIMVNRSFYFSFLHIVTDALSRDKKLDQQRRVIIKDEFSTLAILLKFKPQGAILYLAYLFYKYDKLSTKIWFTGSAQNGVIVLKDEDGNEVPFQPSRERPVTLFMNGVEITDNAVGMVQDTGEVARNGANIRIFMEIYDLIINDSIDLRAIGEAFFKKFNEGTAKRFMFRIIYYVAWYLLFYGLARLFNPETY